MEKSDIQEQYEENLHSLIENQVAASDVARGKAEKNVEIASMLYRAQRRQFFWFIVFVMAFNVAMTLTLFFRPNPASASPMKFDSYSVKEPTSLCPGEFLTYELVLNVQEDAVLESDSSIWATDPPGTAQFSQDYQRAIIEGPITYTTNTRWPVADLPPGDYERRIAVSTSSRSAMPTIISIPFSVREDCP